MKQPARLSAVIGAVALLVALALGGCGASTKTVRVPAPESTVNLDDTDEITLETLPPVPPRGSKTLPTTRRTYMDTLGRSELDVQRVTIDRRDAGEEKIILQYESDSTTIEEEIPLPAPGEATDVQPGPDTTGGPAGSTDVQVRGAPESREREAYVTEDPGWFEQMWDSTLGLLAVVGAIITLLFLLYVLGNMALPG